MKFQTKAILAVFLGLSATAANASDFWSPRIAALGGAGHAGPLLNDSILLNPSYASFLPTYAVSANYSPFRGGTVETPEGPTNFRGRNYNVSIQDGRTEAFQAGISATQREDALLIHLGVSKSILKRIGFGLSGKMARDNGTGTANAESTFSTTGIVSQWLQLSLTVDNLLEREEGKKYGWYREIVLGSKWNIMSIVLAYFDPHYTPSLDTGAFGHELGLEFVIMKDLFLRMGNYRNTNLPFMNGRGRGYSAGFGWVAPRISLDYALTRPTEPRASIAHVFGATIYF